MSREELPLNYAQAVYRMALEEWSSWLEAAHQRLLDDAALAQVLTSEEVSLGEKQRRSLAILPAGASPAFQQFLGFLVDKGHLNMLGEIILAFKRVADRGPVAEIAYISSAVELTHKEREKLQESLRRRFGAGLEFQFAVDPALFGGVRVRVGDTIIDGTVAGRLAALREQLVSE